MTVKLDTGIPGYIYEIPISDLKTENRLNFWMKHLEGKSWFSSQHKKQLLLAHKYR